MDKRRSPFKKSLHTSLKTKRRSLEPKIGETKSKKALKRSSARRLSTKLRKRSIVSKRKPPLRKKTPSVLTRVETNPILAPIREHPWESWQTFNPAALSVDGKIYLLYRALGEDGVSRIGYAKTDDDFTIHERLPHPVYVHGNQPKFHFASFFSGGGFGGVEDPRLVRIGDTAYMTYLSFDGDPRMTLTSIKIEDFVNKTWRWKAPVPISPPGQLHKNWVIFPAKINGKYAILHSISPQVLVDYFDTLNFDGKTYIRSYYTPDDGEDRWDNWVRGVGPPPLDTPLGWLVLYHAMDRRDPGKYKLGALILDKKNPLKVVYRSPEPILEPDLHYENNGVKGGVVYACGAVIHDGRLIVYYGGADTVVCAAYADLEPFLALIQKGGTPKLKQVRLNSSGKFV